MSGIEKYRNAYATLLAMVMKKPTYHERMLATQLKGPEFLAEYERARSEIAQVDQIVSTLDSLRIEAGCTKAELARKVGKNPAVIRRLFTSEVNPELRTVAALAAALGAEIRIIPVDIAATG